MHAYVQPVIDSAVDEQLGDMLDRLVEGMKPRLEQWLELGVTPEDALAEAMRHIRTTLNHPSLTRASNHDEVAERAERKFKEFLQLS